MRIPFCNSPAIRWLFSAICFVAGDVAFGQLLNSDVVLDVDLHAGRALAGWIDEKSAAQWDREGVASPMIVDDGTFLRRLYLDLTGTIPSVATAREFLESTDDYKREIAIEVLLREPRSAAHLARVWRRMLVPTGSPSEAMGETIEPWLKDQFARNAPYDEFAKNLLTVKSIDASDPSKPYATSAIMFYQASGGNAEGVADSATRFFLGVRLGCAKCHDHPFAEWKQEDFWGMAAFFAGVQNGNVEDSPRTTIRPQDSDVEYAAKLLWEEETKVNGANPRQVFADWVVSEHNPNFAATAVNRVWQHLCGRSLAGTVDDLDQANDEERAILLDELSKEFIASKYDLRHLISAICRSKMYQCSTVSPDQLGGQLKVADVRPLKTLSPEQVFDAMEQALMLPVGRSDNAARFNGERATIVARMNEAFSDSPEDFSAGIPQALMMMNGSVISDATDLEKSRTLRAVVDSPFMKDEDRLETLFLATLTRRPTDRERDVLLASVKAQDANRGTVFADIMWALLNSPEFVLSR
jgi:hypothetical protein